MLAKSTLKAHCSCKGYLLFFDICQEPSTHYYGSAAVDEQELAIPILSLCHGTLTNWSIFSTPFLLWKEGSSGPVTQWRQLVSCDWLWHSQGSLIQSRFDLKINRSMKTPWQECSGVACSYSSAPVHVQVYLSNRPHFRWVYRRDKPRRMLGEHEKSL